MRTWMGVVCVALVGCMSSAAVQSKVAERASLDLGCGRDRLSVAKVSVDAAFMGVENATWRVDGCGRRAVYKSSCGGMTGACSVMTESQVRALGGG